MNCAYLVKMIIMTAWTVNYHQAVIKLACTSGPIFKKIMKRHPIFSVQIINYQIDQMHI